MGWGRMLLLGNWGQQMDIEDQREELASLRRQIETTAPSRDYSLAYRLEKLEKENSELRLYLAALIRYLGHEEIVHPDEFRQLIEEIDKDDGNIDGGYRGNIIK